MHRPNPSESEVKIDSGFFAPNVDNWQHFSSFKNAAKVSNSMATKSRVRIKKPAVTYDIVSYYIKAVCPNLFAALTNIFII
jgi:hypothetical protein